jgi:glycosyltransferase involved in cell wall biosynthesis
MKTRNILVITTWGFNEGLIQSYCLPYLKIIHAASSSSRIFLVTQEKGKLFSNKVEEEKTRKELAKSNIYLHDQPYTKFGIRKLFLSVGQFMSLWWLVLSKGVSHIHAFCTPAGGIGYLLSIVTAKNLVIDSYEPHAESMLENGTWGKNSLAYKILWWLEKKQSESADYCIAAASGMKQYAQEKYGVDVKNFQVKPACVDLSLFEFNPLARETIRTELGWNGNTVMVYAGKFGGIYLDKEVFDLLSVAYISWGDRLRVLLLTANSKEEIFEWANQAKLPLEIFYIIQAPFHKVPEYLSASDVALTPVKPVRSKRYCTPIKDGEYWAMGLPVVIPDQISDDSEIIRKHNAGVVLDELTEEAYGIAIQKLDILLKEDRQELRQRIRKLAEDYRNYSIAFRAYRKVYSN